MYCVPLPSLSPLDCELDTGCRKVRAPDGCLGVLLVWSRRRDHDEGEQDCVGLPPSPASYGVLMNISYRYQRIWFRPRILRDVTNIDYKTTMLGKDVSHSPSHS
jgi:hypothetical protein